MSRAGSAAELMGLRKAQMKRACSLCALARTNSRFNRSNIALNRPHINSIHGPGSITAFPLDWSTIPSTSTTPSPPRAAYPIILAADSIYSPSHPPMLANTVAAHLSRTVDARFVFELPLREGYAPEREDLRARLEGKGLRKRANGSHWGWDEHGDRGERREHVWEVWGWA